jgi:hypothetical protein
MKSSNVLALFNNKLKTVGVQFKTHDGSAFGKVYTYKTLEDFKEGDEAVVNAPSTGMTVVRVVDVHVVPDIDVDATFAYQWIVCKIDAAEYDKRAELEAKALIEIEKFQYESKRKKVTNEFAKGMGVKRKDIKNIIDNVLNDISK